MGHKNIKFEDFKIICRICLKINENGTNLFSKLDSLMKESVIAIAVMDCSSIQVQIEDKLPKLICQECIQLLEIAYRFRWLCAQSDMTLRQILSNYENNIKEENTNNDGDESIDDSDTDHLLYPSNSPNTSNIDELKFCDNSEKTVEDTKIVIDSLNNSVDTKEISSDNCKYSVEALKCLKCLRVFKRQYNFQNHQKLCSAEFKKERKIAKMKFEYNLTTAKDEKLVKTPYAVAKDSIQESGDGRYTCRVCMKIFKGKYHAAEHAVVHTDLRYYCPHCDKKFAKTDTLRQHIKNIHTGERKNNPHKKVNNRFNCEFCGRLFKRNSMLIVHLRSHTGIKPFKCDICERTFTESTALRIHSRRHLDLSRKERISDKTFLCSECGKCFCSKESLLLHSSVHTGIKQFNCDVCNRSFARVCSLNRHQLQHTGAKPYSCQICEKKFTQSSHLNRHLTMHQGLKPYFCSFCEKYFSEKGNLKIHMRIHTGEKPFACSICEKAFHDSRGLKKHKRIHRRTDESVNNLE